MDAYAGRAVTMALHPAGRSIHHSIHHQHPFNFFVLLTNPSSSQPVEGSTDPSTSQTTTQIPHIYCHPSKVIISRPMTNALAHTRRTVPSFTCLPANRSRLTLLFLTFFGAALSRLLSSLSLPIRWLRHEDLCLLVFQK